MAEEALDAESQALEERLKSALWYSIGKIVDEETLKLGVNATPQFIGSLTELTWAQIGTTACDLESFALHAGRRTIKTDDVMLLTRRNEGLATILRDFVETKLPTVRNRNRNRNHTNETEGVEKTKKGAGKGEGARQRQGE